ncbi:hypothetical protein GCM10007387_52540 [Pseudoduganella albidiflava]|uniref:Uncharacterized protein n=1 Tax=Pseudoduganella albidiflava TaxID=321983 RepID=A0AA87Y375_9BURK|nr:hypothetical protein GCM10007387_52540 [Pseudoduganella albidiflava]
MGGFLCCARRQAFPVWLAHCRGRHRLMPWRNETNRTGGCMRKMIMMAIAGFIWKKVQARMLNRAPAQGARRRY